MGTAELPTLKLYLRDVKERLLNTGRKQITFNLIPEALSVIKHF